MQQHWWRGKLGLVLEWNCCGHRWQLYPRRWRGDAGWHPTCPKCGSTIPAPRTKED